MRRLEDYCAKAGQNKTMAIEQIIGKYLNEWEQEQEENAE